MVTWPCVAAVTMATAKQYHAVLSQQSHSGDKAVSPHHYPALIIAHVVIQPGILRTSNVSDSTQRRRTMRATRARTTHDMPTVGSNVEVSTTCPLELSLWYAMTNRQ